MKTNNNYISVIAKFIGEDGSRGFSKGTMYLLKMKITDGYIIVSSENNKSLWCPYGSLNTFLENWKLNSGEDEMSEFEKELTKVLDKNDTFSIGITFEEINEILMKNPSKNKEAYDRLTPIVEQKRKVFMNKLKKG